LSPDEEGRVEILGKPRVYVDFMKTDGKGRLLLTTVGTREDLTHLGIELIEGLELDLYSDDADDNGNFDPLLAAGVVIFNAELGKWVARVDRKMIRHASELK
jgi:hypothetical protein